jgi:multiple sugar transport system substrate-binding protein
MKQRRIVSVVGVAVTAALLLTACGSSGSNNKGGSKSASGPVTLTLLEYQKIRADAVAALLPKFEADTAAAGQQIHVNLIRDILPDDQFKTKITQEYTGGNAPDVTDYGATYIPGFAGAGYLLDLTPYLSKWSEWKTFYPQVVEQIKQPDGKTYSLPHEANTQSLFYRKDVLQKLGVSTAQPTSWSELIQRLQAITAKTGQPAIVLPAGTAWGDGTFGEGFLNVMLGSGSPLYDTKSNKWIVKSPGLTKTFTVYADLIKDKLEPVQALLNPEPWQPTKYIAFPKGTLPVAAQGTWGWKYDWGPSGSAPIPNLFQLVDTWNYPSDAGPPYSVSSVGFEYEVTAKTKHPDAAVQLAQWLSGGPAMAAQLVAVGAAAPRSGVDNVAPYSSQPVLLNTEKQLTASRSFPPRPGQDQISQAVAQATEDILTGKSDGPAAAESFAKNATELLTSDQVETQGS